jgi:hypothetical protein
LATELKIEIGGEFIFENGRLSFVDDSGRSVDKNLISFGMRPFSKINSPPISIFNSVANSEIISNGGLVDLVFKVSSKS